MGVLNVTAPRSVFLSFNVEHTLALSAEAGVFQGKEVAARAYHCVLYGDDAADFPKSREEDLQSFTISFNGQNLGAEIFS